MKPCILYPSLTQTTSLHSERKLGAKYIFKGLAPYWSLYFTYVEPTYIHIITLRQGYWLSIYCLGVDSLIFLVAINSSLIS